MGTLFFRLYFWSCLWSTCILTELYSPRKWAFTKLPPTSIYALCQTQRELPTSVTGAECQLHCTQWPITVFFASVNITFLVKIFRTACKVSATIALEWKVTLKTFLHGSNGGDSSIPSQKWQHIIPIFPPQTLPSRLLKTFLRWVLSFLFSSYLNISSQTSQGDDYLPSAWNQPGVFYTL